MGDGMSCCGRLVLDESMALGVDPEKLMVRDGNEGAEGRGGKGKDNGLVSGGDTGNVRDAEAKKVILVHVNIKLRRQKCTLMTLLTGRLCRLKELRKQPFDFGILFTQHLQLAFVLLLLPTLFQPEFCVAPT